MNNRRAFLRKSSLITLSPLVPGFIARTADASVPQRDDRVLVVIHLNGGNDGVNTLVPFTDEGYAKHRRKLLVKPENLLKLDRQFGLHPRMRSAADLWEAGKLAMVPAVGYPNPNRSHDASIAIWQTCQFTPIKQNGHGWIGLALDQKPHPGQTPMSLFVGDREQPIALQGRKCSGASLTNLNDYVLPAELRQSMSNSKPVDPTDDLSAFLQRRSADAFSMSSSIEQLVGKSPSSVEYPATRLATELKTVSQLLKAGFGTRVFYTIQDGYDTHSGQYVTHGDLLGALSDAVKAFLDDLKASRLDERVMVLCFSEFGRRVDENGSAGTDHGTGGLLLLAGTHVNAGIHGKYPSLLDLEDGGLKSQTDFRQVYATLLKGWLRVDPTPSLKDKFTDLPLLRRG